MAMSHGQRHGRHRQGITLLEVLISCALLIVGLTAIAGLLPAAGTRLAQATVEDRASLLLSNAMAEVANRGLVTARTYPVENAETVARTVVIGPVLGDLPTLGVLPNGQNSSAYFTAAAPFCRERCGSTRTFFLEDVLAYERSPYADVPLNAFSRDTAGLGPRSVRRGLCWAAMLTPIDGATTAGSKAILSIGIFNRGGRSEDEKSETGIPIAMKRAGSYYEAAIATSESFLGGCSQLLAIPQDPNKVPRWFRIVTSWNAAGGAGFVKRLIIDNQVEFAELTGSTALDSTAVVVAFDGIVKVDEQVVTLD